jgi:quercetin dioxygenase-like cupin family protein
MADHRRIVTGLRAGRSAILHDAPAPARFRWGEIAWPLEPGDPDRTALAPGEVSWRLYTLTGDAELGAYVAARYGRAAGMHETPTVDLVHVLEGRVALVLDEDTVELGPGDLVVQQATAHAWRILEDPVRLSVVMIGVPSCPRPAPITDNL